MVTTAAIALEGAGTARLGAQVPSWPVPEAAVVEWLDLVVALAGVGRAPACAADPETWFASGARAADQIAEAVAACQRCPVRLQCRAYAVAADEREGVWGGSTVEERRALAGRSR